MLKNTIITKEALEYAIPEEGLYLPIRTQDGSLVGTCKVTHQDQDIKISNIHICDPTMEMIMKSEQDHLCFSIDGRITQRDTNFKALALENITATLSFTKRDQD